MRPLLFRGNLIAATAKDLKTYLGYGICKIQKRRQRVYNEKNA